MSTLNGRITLFSSLAYQSALDNQTVNADIGQQLAVDLTNGTGSGNANAVFSDVRSLSSGGNEELDLAGSLTDAFGATLTFTKVKALIIWNPTANTVNITVGGAASNTFTGPFGDASDVITIQPGGFFAITAPKTGYTVTASTGDKLKVLAGAADLTYGIHIVGTV